MSDSSFDGAQVAIGRAVLGCPAIVIAVCEPTLLLGDDSPAPPFGGGALREGGAASSGFRGRRDLIGRFSAAEERVLLVAQSLLLLLQGLQVAEFPVLLLCFDFLLK